jgi:hypothetical protein
VASTVTTTCDPTSTDAPGCPPLGPNDHWAGVGCTIDPPNQCTGLVIMAGVMGSATVFPGCWTSNR